MHLIEYAFVRTQLEWKLRKETLNSKKTATEYIVPEEFGSKKVTLTTEQIEEIGSFESFLQKKKPILVIRESGMRDTKFPKHIKFAGSSDAKELQVKSIWLSPEGFDEILFGMKLPDATGKLKMTPSAFLREFERMTSSK
jgi:hypothetical protein